MSIVLLILQILGITLLILLGIVLLLLLLILFTPLRYLVEGDIHEAKWIKARFSWLLHLISLWVTYEDNLIYGEARILWRKTTFSYDLTETKNEPEETSKETSDKSNEEKNKPSEKKKNKGNVIDKIKDGVEKIKIAYPRIKKILTDDRNKKAVHHLKEELFYFIKILLPKKSRVRATFSTGSPDTTGQLCCGLALFPVIYKDGWELCPDFVAESAYFEGDFYGKGRLYLYQIVGILLRIVFDKNCRRMYTMIDRLIKSIKKTKVQEDK